LPQASRTRPLSGQKIEEMAAGSLFAAARGMGRPGDVPLDEQTCLERGQFMSGSCAGLIHEMRKLRSFHRELAEGPLSLHHPVVGEIGTFAEPSAAAPLDRGTTCWKRRRDTHSPPGRSRKDCHHRDEHCQYPGEQSGGNLGGKPGDEERHHPLSRRPAGITACFMIPGRSFRTRPTARWAPSWISPSPALISAFLPRISGP